MDIASLLKAPDSDESSAAPPQHARSSSVPSTTATTAATAPVSGLPPYVPPPVAPGLAASGKRAMPPHVAESPAKKQSKWSPEEDALIIELRGSGMKWEDISKRLPGRSAISCRLHYQNYLERRSEWDEERKNKLARLYERYESPRRDRGRKAVFHRPTTRRAELTWCPDSNRRCGRKLQRRWQFLGVLRKLCTGSWAKRTWPGVLAWCLSPSQRSTSINQAAATDTRPLAATCTRNPRAVYLGTLADLPRDTADRLPAYHRFPAAESLLPGVRAFLDGHLWVRIRTRAYSWRALDRQAAPAWLRSKACRRAEVQGCFRE